jgi:hypothetical protein
MLHKLLGSLSGESVVEPLGDHTIHPDICQQVQALCMRVENLEILLPAEHHGGVWMKGQYHGRKTSLVSSIDQALKQSLVAEM